MSWVRGNFICIGFSDVNVVFEGFMVFRKIKVWFIVVRI